MKVGCVSFFFITSSYFLFSLAFCRFFVTSLVFLLVEEIKHISNTLQEKILCHYLAYGFSGGVVNVTTVLR